MGERLEATRPARISGVHRLPRELSLRDARQLREASRRFQLRALACRIAQRNRAALTALGALGVCGFVAALGCLRAGLIGSASYVVAVSGSLSALVASLSVALLGDPRELERRRARAMRKSARSFPEIRLG